MQLQHILKDVLIMDTEFPAVNLCYTIGHESIICLVYVLNPTVNTQVVLNYIKAFLLVFDHRCFNMSMLAEIQ